MKRTVKPWKIEDPNSGPDEWHTEWVFIELPDEPVSQQIAVSYHDQKSHKRALRLAKRIARLPILEAERRLRGSLTGPKAK